jgi:hypothetical protein
MANNAVLWIRDGVLVNRMHINPVAFAASVWVFVAPERRRITTIEALINFGFEKSGISCAEKMSLYNKERENILDDIEHAASFYNQLATEAAAHASYFVGAVELLESLHRSGTQNFITSAVEQETLDEWSTSEQGAKISPFLKEILGKRSNFSKGRDHFEHVHNQGYERLYLVADAPSEIRMGTEFSQQFNITPIGFANVVRVEDVMEAVELVTEALMPLAQQRAPIPVRKLRVDASRLTLPDQHEIEKSLVDAGAAYVVAGTAKDIMSNLRNYLTDLSM